MANVTVTLPTQLAQAIGASREVTIQAEDLNQLIEALAQRYNPTLKERLINKGKELNPIINIYINGRNIRYTGGLDTKLKEGDKISILPAVAGG